MHFGSGRERAAVGIAICRHLIPEGGALQGGAAVALRFAVRAVAGLTCGQESWKLWKGHTALCRAKRIVHFEGNKEVCPSALAFVAAQRILVCWKARKTRISSPASRSVAFNLCRRYDSACSINGVCGERPCDMAALCTVGDIRYDRLCSILESLQFSVIFSGKKTAEFAD